MEDHLGSPEIIWFKIYISFLVRWLHLFQLLNKNNFPLFGILRLNCSISKIYIILSHCKGRIWISRHLCVHNTGQYSMHCSLCRCRVGFTIWIYRHRTVLTTVTSIACGFFARFEFPATCVYTEQYWPVIACGFYARHEFPATFVYRTVQYRYWMWFLCKIWISRHLCLQNTTVPVLLVGVLQGLNHLCVQ